MVDLGCLSDAPASTDAQLLSGGIFNFVAALLIVAVALAALGAPLLRWRYRARVIRLMHLDEVQARPDGWWRRRQAARAPGGAASADPTQWTTVATRSARRVAIASTVAWIAFGLTGLLVCAVALPGRSWIVRGQFACGAALLALGPLASNLPASVPRRRLILAALALVAVYLGIAALDSNAGTASNSPIGASDIVAVIIAIPFAWATLFQRRLRGQLLPLVVVVAASMLFFLLSVAGVEPYMGRCFEVAAAEPGSSVTTYLLVGAAMFVAGWLGVRTLDAMAQLVERGWLGVSSMSAAIGLAIVALAMVFGSVTGGAGRPPPLAAWMPLLWLSATIAVYVLALGVLAPGGSAPVAAPQLLVLRVFARDAKQLDLLDGVQERWRFLGPVHEIGGPDLVATNVDPYECAMFIAGRLHELFLPEAPSAEQLQSRLVTGADREGRFRVNELFCFNTAWRRTVEQLMQTCEAILLDLRGLTPDREGTLFEIGRLVHFALLERTVAVGDASTDWSHVDVLLRSTGADPRRLPRWDPKRGIDTLFDRLVVAAARPR